MYLVISIHALLAESDVISSQILGGDNYFYPRSPCGERRPFRVFIITIIEISIHALLAESDLLTVVPNGQYKISIHALLAESDRILE